MKSYNHDHWSLIIDQSWPSTILKNSYNHAHLQSAPATAWVAASTPLSPSVKLSWETPPGDDDNDLWSWRIRTIFQVSLPCGFPASANAVHKLRPEGGSTPWQTDHHNRWDCFVFFFFFGSVDAYSSFAITNWTFGLVSLSLLFSS